MDHRLEVRSLPDQCSLQNKQQELVAMQQHARQAEKAHKVRRGRGTNPRQAQVRAPGRDHGVEHLQRLALVKNDNVPLPAQTELAPDGSTQEGPPPPENPRNRLETQDWQEVHTQLQDSHNKKPNIE